MQMSKIFCSPSLAFDSAHVKYGVSNGPLQRRQSQGQTVDIPATYESHRNLDSFSLSITVRVLKYERRCQNSGIERHFTENFIGRRGPHSPEYAGISVL